MKHQIQRGFSLSELIVVIAIIALLIGILLPAVSRIRESGRSTVCLANLQQWGYVYHSYLSSARQNRIGMISSSNNYAGWWETIGGYSANMKAALLCPSASHPIKRDLASPATGWINHQGSNTEAWSMYNPSGEHIGSYAFNWAVCDYDRKRMPAFVIDIPAKDPSNIPLIVDGAKPQLLVRAPVSAVPTSLDGIDAWKDDLHVCCLDRHNRAVNVVFLDGHAEHLKLERLWQLKWSQNSVPKDVQLPVR